VPKLGKYIGPVDEKTIAKRLRELRKASGKTQAEVAGRLGIPQPLLSEYERGTVRLHAAIVAAFAKLFEVPADEVLGLKPPKKNGAFKDRRFFRRLERIEKLPRRAKDALLKTIDTYLAGVEKGHP
jgi:transcriptional regulator with XRE-family HTH domain